MGEDGGIRIHLQLGARPTPMGVLHGCETAEGASTCPSGFHACRLRTRRRLPGMARHNTVSMDVHRQASTRHACEGHSVRPQRRLPLSGPNKHHQAGDIDSRSNQRDACNGPGARGVHGGDGCCTVSSGDTICSTQHVRRRGSRASSRISGRARI
eukprot:2211787-Rhodomonas_salina.1